jgi:hypothetical protein
MKRFLEKSKTSQLCVQNANFFVTKVLQNSRKRKSLIFDRRKVLPRPTGLARPDEEISGK